MVSNRQVILASHIFVQKFARCPQQIGHLASPRDCLRTKSPVLPGIPITFRCSRRGAVRHRWRLARLPAAGPRSASAAEMHGLLPGSPPTAPPLPFCSSTRRGTGQKWVPGKASSSGELLALMRYGGGECFGRSLFRHYVRSR